ncbi:odorant receptor 4-like [Leptopilina heterotoma]|uniref:odorant receptor 4-like n=1 Tax=Leptopilina heterotoma TaxID=63436 RepID=UPI001CA9FDF3|nr:odorant receptor 4-like [Leptopilina heterotoma]
MDGKQALDYFTKYSYNSLVLIGFWPVPTCKYKQVINFQCIFSFLFLTFSLVIPQGFRLTQVWGDIDLMSNVLCTAELPFLVALSKMIILFYLSVLFDKFLDDWKRKKSDEELDIMNISAQFGKKISLLCIFLGQATPVARLVQIIFENLSNWSSSDHLKNFTLYIDAYYPYEWNYTPVYEITCFMEYIGTFMAALAYSGTDGLFSEIAFHLSGQYHILRHKLFHIVNEIDENTSLTDIDESFSYIVKFHDRINSCIDIVEDTFSFMCLVQLLACSIQFCIQCYLLVLCITVQQSSPILFDILFILVFLTYMTANFYVYCYLAEKLQSESFAFAEAAYICNWYTLPPKKIKYFLLLIQRGRKPVNLTAGKFCIINLILFASIIKTSMGYLSFLLTMRSAQK